MINVPQEQKFLGHMFVNYRPLEIIDNNKLLLI